MGIGAAIGGIATVGGALISSSAASSAGKTQAGLDKVAMQNELTTQNQNYTNFAPYMFAGQTATSQLQNLLGSNGGDSQKTALSQNGLSGLTFQPTQAQLEQTPGYQFDLAQGQQAVANSNAAQGRGVSGAALKGAAQYATGLANNTLMSQDQIFQNNLNNVISPLQNLASMGEGATAANAGVATTSQGQQATALTNQGNALASGQVGSANAVQSGLNGLSNNLSQYSMINALSGSGNGIGAAINGTGGLGITGGSGILGDGTSGNLGSVIGGGGGYSGGFVAN